LRFLKDISSFFDISVSKFQNSVGNLPKDEGLRKRAVLLKGPKRPRVL